MTHEYEQSALIPVTAPPQATRAMFETLAGQAVGRALADVPDDSGIHIDLRGPTLEPWLDANRLVARHVNRLTATAHVDVRGRGRGRAT